MQLILASASPRRKEILEAHGHAPVVIPADAEETLPDKLLLLPEEASMYLAELKADVVFNTLSIYDYPEGCRIVAVDTIVFKDLIIGKPYDEKDALRILRALRNSEHDVVSGVCVIVAKALHGKLTPAEKHIFYDSTTVRFGEYTDEEILDYIRANPPYDKSGSYAIQSEWGRHVKSVSGDIENVIGLPYAKLRSYL